MNINLSFNAKEFFASLGTPHPLRDWILLLSFAVVGLVVVVGIGVYYFFGIQSGTIIGDTSAQISPAPRVSRVELEKMVETFTQRAVNFEAGAIEVPEFSDPSL